MKNILTLATLALLSVSASSNAAVLVVNNNNPSPGQYITLSAAQSAASPGDTLLVTGSVYNYNSLIITKRLTIIGTGHSPFTPNPAPSKLDDITFSGTAANLFDINIIGLDINSINYNVAGTHRQYVSRCKIRSYIYLGESQDSILIDGNYFSNSGYCFQAIASYNFNNITLRNNVFNGQFYQYYPSTSSGNNLYVFNNLFLVNGYAFAGSNRYLTFRNNIFYRADPNSAITSSDFDYNLIYKAFYGTNAFPSSSNTVGIHNLNNVDPLFVSYPAAGAYYSYAHDLNLQSTSTAINAGSDGKDIGLTGGDGYFQKYGIPNIPQVNQFSITSPSNATIAPGGNLQISVNSSIAR